MDSNASQKLLVISGPTASGKSYLAEELLKRYSNVVVINADSMQVYKDLPILSAQPNDVANNYRYALYSFLNFDEHCSAGLWLKAAEDVINRLFLSSKQPVVVGGTGLYLKALLEGLADIPDISGEVKKQTQEQFLKLGKEKFYELLTSIDPKAAGKIHKNDSYRMQRALEVYMQTGRSIDSFKSSGSSYKAVLISIAPDRETLYKHCNLRFEEMLKAGAEQEARLLFEKIKAQPGKYNIENTLGYRSLASYFLGNISLKDAIAEASQATRNYAKRQCTWFNNQFPNKISLAYSLEVEEIKERFLKTVEQQL
jgi:tRNA dimethylallyltransferase